jgi:hypothetical protein
MTGTRLGIFLLIAMLATAQQASSPRSAKSSTPEPKLPVIDYNACPFEGCVFRKWTVTKRCTIYDTWQDSRKTLGYLNKGEEVQGLTGVHITRMPDRFLVTQPIPYLSLKAGDVVLQYAEWGEGAADLWAKGVWHKGFDWGQVDGTDGGVNALVFRDDNIILVRHGIKEWWVEVRRIAGQTGWAAGCSFGNIDRFGYIRPLRRTG